MHLFLGRLFLRCELFFARQARRQERLYLSRYHPKQAQEIEDLCQAIDKMLREPMKPDRSHRQEMGIVR